MEQEQPRCRWALPGLFMHWCCVKSPYPHSFSWLCSPAIDLKYSNATTYSGTFGKHNEPQWREFKYNGVGEGRGWERLTQGEQEGICLYFFPSEFLHCFVFFTYFFHLQEFLLVFNIPVSQATSPALLARSTCFEMTYSHTEILSACGCVCVYVYDWEFVVSRAFSLAPETLAKSVVRFGSPLLTQCAHTQSCAHADTHFFHSYITFFYHFFCRKCANPLCFLAPPEVQ